MFLYNNAFYNTEPYMSIFKYESKKRYQNAFARK